MSRQTWAMAASRREGSEVLPLRDSISKSPAGPMAGLYSREPPTRASSTITERLELESMSARERGSSAALRALISEHRYEDAWQLLRPSCFAATTVTWDVARNV